MVATASRSLLKRWFEPAVTPLYVVVSLAVGAGIFMCYHQITGSDIQLFNKHEFAWEQIDPKSPPRKLYMNEKFAKTFEKN